MRKVDENKLQKKNALLQSSFDLFLSHGFSKTTISDISKKAGLAKGTFYLYFKDKYDLRDKLIGSKASQLLEEAHQVMISRPAAPDFETAVLEMCDYVIEQLEKDQKLLYFLSKNLSWGIFKNILEHDISTEESIPFMDYYKEKLSYYHVRCEHVDLMLFTVIELVSSTCYSCIIHQQPVSMKVYQPFLHESIRAILKVYLVQE